jgi:hypothetical protein
MDTPDDQVLAFVHPGQALQISFSKRGAKCVNRSFTFAGTGDDMLADTPERLSPADDRRGASPAAAKDADRAKDAGEQPWPSAPYVVAYRTGRSLDVGQGHHEQHPMYHHSFVNTSWFPTTL